MPSLRIAINYQTLVTQQHRTKEGRPLKGLDLSRRAVAAAGGGLPQPAPPGPGVPQGRARVRPAWSPGGDQRAYVIGRPPADGQPAGFEVWSARADASQPALKVAELPVDVFARGHSASLCWT